MGWWEKQKRVWWCNSCQESIFSSQCALSVCVCRWQLPDPAAPPWPQSPAAPQESRSLSTCPSQTGTHCMMCEGISSHWACSFIILPTTSNMTYKASWEMLGSRNIFTHVSSRIKCGWQFPHCGEICLVLWQWYFDYSQAKPELSLISLPSKSYSWGNSVSKRLPSYSLCSGSITCSFTSTARASLGFSWGEVNWEKQQWPVPLIHGLYCPAISLYLN